MSPYRDRHPPPGLDRRGHFDTCYAEDGVTLVRCQVNRCADARHRLAFWKAIERRSTPKGGGE